MKNSLYLILVALIAIVLYVAFAPNDLALRTSPQSPDRSLSAADLAYIQEAKQIALEYVDLLRSLRKEQGKPGEADRRTIDRLATEIEEQGERLRSLQPSPRLVPVHDRLIEGATHLDRVAGNLSAAPALTDTVYDHAQIDIQKGLDKIIEATDILRDIEAAASR